MRLLSIRRDRWGAQKDAVSIDETCPWINTGRGAFGGRWKNVMEMRMCGSKEAPDVSCCCCSRPVWSIINVVVDGSTRHARFTYTDSDMCCCLYDRSMSPDDYYSCPFSFSGDSQQAW